MELNATTFVFVPGLLSDRIVWEPLAEQFSENVFHADLTMQPSIPEMASSVLASTQGNLVVVTPWAGVSPWKWRIKRRSVSKL